MSSASFDFGGTAGSTGSRPRPSWPGAGAWPGGNCRFSAGDPGAAEGTGATSSPTAPSRGPGVPGCGAGPSPGLGDVGVRLDSAAAPGDVAGCAGGAAGSDEGLAGA